MTDINWLFYYFKYHRGHVDFSPPLIEATEVWMFLYCYTLYATMVVRARMSAYTDVAIWVWMSSYSNGGFAFMQQWGLTVWQATRVWVSPGSNVGLHPFCTSRIHSQAAISDIWSSSGHFSQDFLYPATAKTSFMIPFTLWLIGTNTVTTNTAMLTPDNPCHDVILLCNTLCIHYCTCSGKWHIGLYITDVCLRFKLFIRLVKANSSSSVAAVRVWSRYNKRWFLEVSVIKARIILFPPSSNYDTNHTALGGDATVTPPHMKHLHTRNTSIVARLLSLNNDQHSFSTITILSNILH